MKELYRFHSFFTNAMAARLIQLIPTQKSIKKGNSKVGFVTELNGYALEIRKL
jgi:hypothetical protein